MTQCARLLELLKTGPKTTAELLNGVPCIVHSRVAQLRERGHDIVCERIPGEGASAYLYTLVSLGESTEGEHAVDSPSVSGVEDEPSLSSSLPERRSAPEQLTVWSAAA